MSDKNFPLYGNLFFTAQVTRSSARVKDICQQLRKPSDATAKSIAKLFPACASSTKRKRKFSPADDCVFIEQQRRKKAVNPLSSGRAKTVTVVVIREIPCTIPRGSLRGQLKRMGRIKDLSFRRSLSADEVRDVILEGFKATGIENFVYLQAHRSNTLTKSEDQKLNGNEVIALAGSGCLYLQEPQTPPSSECSSPDVPADQDAVESESATGNSLSLKGIVTEMIKKLRVSEFLD